MDTSTLFAFIALSMAAAFLFGRSRSMAQANNAGGVRTLNSLPSYYGMLTLLWCGIPSLAILVAWIIFDDMIIHQLLVQSLPEAVRSLDPVELNLRINSIENIAASGINQDAEPYMLEAVKNLNSLQETSRLALSGLALLVAALTGLWGWSRIQPDLKARNQVENAFKIILLACSCLAILTTVGIVLSVLFESIRFFNKVPITEFIFGSEWSPQMAIRADQVGGSGAFGAIPLFVGTMLISLIAMIVAVPAGLMAAIYLSEYAGATVRALVKPALEILAGIPTVVYGFFAALTVAPMIRETGGLMGLSVSSESALAAGLVMGVMIIPFVSSLSDDVINAVPQSLRDGSLGLGSTQSETIRQVVIPAALPGIVSGILLAVSRAIGETMIVVMAASLAANLTANPLEPVTTVTVQIVTLLVGDQEFDSPKTLAAFALGLMLFIVTLGLNFIALHVVKKYREQYD